MLDWLQLMPAVFVALLLILVPGAAVGFALRLRGLTLWGFAPAAGTAAIAVSAIALSLLGVRWSLWTAAAAMLVLIGIAVLIGWLLRLPAIALGRRSLHRMPSVAVCVGAVLGMVRMAVIIGAPSNFSQTNDATFHLNALRYIQESGSASSLNLTDVLGAEAFYPASWHGIASLVMFATGADEIHAANAVSLAIAGPVWTVSIAALVWAATGSRRATALSALFAPACAAFPFLMLDFGVLYPYALAIAILPGAVAVVPAWWRHRMGSRIEGGPVRSGVAREGVIIVVISAVGFVGIALSQPAVLLVWLSMIAPLLIGEVVATWQRQASSAFIVRRVVTLIGAAAVVLVAWKILGSLTSGDQWGPLQPWYQALGQLVINAPLDGTPAFIVSALSVIGFIVAVRRAELRWMAALAVGLAALDLLAVSVQSELLRGFLLDPWYGDPRRLLALMPLVAVMLAAIGADTLLTRLHGASARWARLATTVIVALVVIETMIWTFSDRLVGEDTYSTTSKSFVSTDERALLEELPKLVGDDAVIVGNPSAGAGFGYVLSGRDVIPRTWSLPNDSDYQVLRTGLVDVEKDPAVCKALERMRVDYVLDFGPSDQGPGRWDMPGLTGFAHAKGFELVAKKGSASLWKITACGLGG